MEFKNYLKTKPQFFIVPSLSMILSSCSSTKDFTSNNSLTNSSQNNAFQTYFDDKAMAYKTSHTYNDLYFNDLTTYRANYFSGKLFLININIEVVSINLIM
jgi:hypothetical protein